MDIIKIIVLIVLVGVLIVSSAYLVASVMATALYGDSNKVARSLELQMEGRCIYCMDIAIAIYPPTKLYSCSKHYELFVSAVQDPSKVEWWSPFDSMTQEEIKQLYELEKTSLHENKL